MYILILFFPFINFLILFFFGFLLSQKSIKILTLHNMFITVLIAFFIFFEVGLKGSNCYILISHWIFLEKFILNFNLNFDTLNSLMLIIITFISFLVHIYSYNYMKDDPNFIKFISYLSLFTFFMITLVTANNFIQMFIGWEGVGIISFLLISFWNTRYQAIKSSLKAIILNRIGDISLLIAISLIYIYFNTIDYDILFAIIENYKDKTVLIFNFEIKLLNIINLLIFIGAVGKSAQIGLHIWLPDAMEGPTPVSALIHAATMVTAGIFLLIKCSYLLEMSPEILKLIAILGSITVFLAGSIGLVQYDIKKVIAYSTCSQLGYMFVACGFSSYNLSLFHLYNHAFFKALLFLSAGAIIHALNDEQDIRKMGALRKLTPFIYAVFLIGSLALMGVPFLTGYYSKDLILELSFVIKNSYSLYIYILITFGAFLTSYYSLRLIFFVFFNTTNSKKKIISNIHEVDIIMGLPLFILAICSIFIGYLFKDFFLGIGTDSWNNSFFFNFQNSNILEIEFFTPTILKIIPIFLIFFNILITTYIYVLNKKKTNNYLIKLNNNRNIINNLKLFIQNFFLKKWYIDYYAFNIFSKKILKLGYNNIHLIIEKNLIEKFIVFNIINFIIFNAKKIYKMQYTIENALNIFLKITIIFIIYFLLLQTFDIYISFIIFYIHYNYLFFFNKKKNK